MQLQHVSLGFFKLTRPLLIYLKGLSSLGGNAVFDHDVASWPGKSLLPPHHGGWQCDLNAEASSRNFC